MVASVYHAHANFLDALATFSFILFLEPRYFSISALVCDGRRGAARLVSSIPRGGKSTGAGGTQTRGAGRGQEVLTCCRGGNDMFNAVICSALKPVSALSVSPVELPGVADSASLPSSNVENSEKEFRCG